MNLKKKIKQIRKEIKKSNNPIMLFDRDADGVTSYLQLKNKYDKIIGFPLTKDLEKQKRLISTLDKKTDLILIFDIPYLEEEFLETIKDKNIIWVDHHQTNSKQLIEKYNILHLNPLDYDAEDNRPATYMTYIITNYKKNLPYVGIGSISDFFLLDVLIKFYKFDKKLFQETINITKEKKKEIFKFIKKYKFNDKENNDKRSEYIKYLTYEANVIKLKNFFDLLFKLDTEEEIIETIRIIEKLTFQELVQNLNNKRTKLYKNYSKINKEYEEILIKAIRKKPKKGFYFFEYKGKISFTRQISEYLSYKLDNVQILVTCFKKSTSEWYALSFRGNNYDVNELVTKTIKGLKGNGGGHKYAAGAVVNEKDYEIFKDRLENNLNSTLQ